MTFHEAERAYSKYLRRLKRQTSWPVPPPRHVMRVLRAHAAEVREYNEYVRLKAKFEGPQPPRTTP